MSLPIKRSQIGVRSVKASVCLLVLLSASLSTAQVDGQLPLAQPKPDMSGVWIIDLSQSDVKKRNLALSFDQLSLVIAHHEPKIKVTRKAVTDGRESSTEFTLHTDGRGKSSLVFTTSKGDADYLIRVKVKSAWEGGTLLTKGTIQYHSVIGWSVFFVGVKERWELSPDGNTLTLISSYGPRRAFASDVFVGDQYFEHIKRVFKRVS
jgi:hypothetical protein